MFDADPMNVSMVPSALTAVKGQARLIKRLPMVTLDCGFAARAAIL